MNRNVFPGRYNANILSGGKPMTPFTSSAYFPGTGVNDNSTGTGAWTNPGNVTANDASYTFALTGPTTQYLKATNPNPSLAAGSIITQVDLVINRNDGFNNNSVKDAIVKLVVAGAVTGSNLADTVTSWGGSFSSVTYSFTGLNLSVADVTASNFGAVLSATVGSGEPQVNYMNFVFKGLQP